MKRRTTELKVPACQQKAEPVSKPWQRRSQRRSSSRHPATQFTVVIVCSQHTVHEPYPKFGSDVKTDDAIFLPREYGKVHYSHNDIL